MRIIDRPINFDQDFRMLLDGIPDIERLLTSARQRYTELHQVDHTRPGLTRLEKRWYMSLAHGTPDYGVYLADDYLSEAWACWLMYSRKALKQICLPNSLSSGSILADLSAMGIHTIADLGCGIGMTTAALTELFPEARVIGTNVSGCAQYQIASRLGKQYGFLMVGSLTEITFPVDLVLASEYFEHFLYPVEHLLEVIETLRPRALLIANAFNVVSTGHFPAYAYRNTSLLDGQAISRIFNNTLRTHGYQKIPTHLWNNRPAYWKRR